MQALLRAPYINERAGGGRSRIRQCLVSANPSEPALLHRWTSLKVKTFPHQGFVKENGCIFLEAIIFILLSVLESNPRKPSAPGLTGLSACCCRAAMGPGRSAGSGLPPAALLSPPCTQGCRKHPYHWRSKDRAKPRAESLPGRGGYLGHSGFQEGTVPCSHPASAAAGVVVPPTKEHSSSHGPWSHVPRHCSCNSD